MDGCCCELAPPAARRPATTPTRFVNPTTTPPPPPAARRLAGRTPTEGPAEAQAAAAAAARSYLLSSRIGRPSARDPDRGRGEIRLRLIGEPHEGIVVVQCSLVLMTAGVVMGHIVVGCLLALWPLLGSARLGLYSLLANLAPAQWASDNCLQPAGRTSERTSGHTQQSAAFLSERNQFVPRAATQPTSAGHEASQVSPARSIE